MYICLQYIMRIISGKVRMSDLYDKLSYVPLPNLKICLKKYLKDEDQRDKVDKYTKSEVITKFRSLNLKDTDILDIYTQYKFGKNLSFQLFYTNRMNLFYNDLMFLDQIHLDLHK